MNHGCSKSRRRERGGTEEVKEEVKEEEREEEEEEEEGELRS